MKKILFKPKMIKAILEGRKTQTRRVIKPKFKEVFRNEYCYEEKAICKPRFKIDEIIYIGESFTIDITGKPIYKLDESVNFQQSFNWTSPLFMPERAARIFLKILTIKSQRLQDITSIECYKEGITIKQGHQYDTICPIYNFRELWDSINKPPYSWLDNPYVFVYEFTKIDYREISKKAGIFK